MGEQVAARVGDGDLHAAPVLVIRRAFHEPLGDEPAHQTRHRRLRDGGRVGQVGEPHRPAPVQHGERGGRDEAEPVAGTEPGEQDDELVDAFGDPEPIERVHP